MFNIDFVLPEDDLKNITNSWKVDKNESDFDGFKIY